MLPLNCCSVFLLPLVEVPNRIFYEEGDVGKNRFLNSFYYRDLGKSIRVVFGGSSEFAKIVHDKLIGNRNYSGSRYSKEFGHLNSVEFNFPKEFEQEFQHFLEGKYSLYREHARELVYRFTPYPNPSYLVHIFTKSFPTKFALAQKIGIDTELLRDKELWDIQSPDTDSMKFFQEEDYLLRLQ